MATAATTTTTPHNPTSATAISPTTATQQQQQQQKEEVNGRSLASKGTYPSPTATYEEVIQSQDLFWEKLQSFHKSFGTKFKVPTVGGKALDVHRLFVEVTSRGGLEKVIRDRRWKEVIATFDFPTTITSASFVLRKYYVSLLYHFEQVYLFHKQDPTASVREAFNQNCVNGSASLEEGANMNQMLDSPELQLGSLVTGIIDGKFDDGYLITVNLGSDRFKGVLYHVPTVSQMSESSHTWHVHVPPRRRRRRSRLMVRDPSRPKSNRSGYNFFFAEHYARLKPHHHGQERVIGKKIGHLWNNLTESEKQVYQEKGMKDKERYRTEMLEYRASWA